MKSKNYSLEIQEAGNCRAAYVTTMLTKSVILHPALELCGKPVFRGKPIDDATRFSIVGWMDYKC